LVVRERPPEHPTGGAAGAIELVVGIVHLVHAEDGLEATLVEGAVVRHQWKTGYLRFYLFPYIREDGGLGGVSFRQPVYLGEAPQVPSRFGADKTVVVVCDDTIADNYYAYAAYAGALRVGYLKINGSEIFHNFFGAEASTFPFRFS
jgi:hypothetical protein